MSKDSEYRSEVESIYEESDSETGSDTECESDYSCENNTKRRKTQDSTATEVLLTDEKGHIKWYPGQRLNAFEIKSALGQGAYGRVLRVRNVKTGQLAALKVIKNEETTRKAAMAEIIALTVIACRDHRNTSFCMKMLSWFSYGGHVCIAFPLMGCSVYDFLKENKFQPFSIDEVRHISYQLCSAVAFLHKNGITHTDLKPENMLFLNSSYTTVDCEKTKSQLRRLYCTDIRLSDFGNVTRDNECHHPVITTRYYRAPEVILRLDWTHSCDIWSIGGILVELYDGDLFFPTDKDADHLAMMEKILGKVPTEMVNASKTNLFKNGCLDWNWSEAEEGAEEHCKPLEEFRLADRDEDNQLFQVIRQMLQYEPHRRIHLTEALMLPFFDKRQRSEHKF